MTKPKGYLLNQMQIIVDIDGEYTVTTVGAIRKFDCSTNVWNALVEFESIRLRVAKSTNTLLTGYSEVFKDKQGNYRTITLRLYQAPVGIN